MTFTFTLFLRTTVHPSARTAENALLVKFERARVDSAALSGSADSDA